MMMKMMIHVHVTVTLLSLVTTVLISHAATLASKMLMHGYTITPNKLALENGEPMKVVLKTSWSDWL